jgi:hypothetical protein
MKRVNFGSTSPANDIGIFVLSSVIKPSTGGSTGAFAVPGETGRDDSVFDDSPASGAKAAT